MSYPVPGTQYSKLYLTGSKQLSANPPDVSSQLSYKADFVPTQPDGNNEELIFAHLFQKPTWMIGYSKAILYISAEVAQDLDVYVQLRKMNKSGKILQHLNVPLERLVPPKQSADEVPNSCFLKYLGPTGVIRATHSKTQIQSSDLDAWPRYRHDQKEETVNPGQVYRLEVPIWPSGISFNAGESLILKVSGHYMSMMEFDFLNEQRGAANKGNHTLHLGHEEGSHLIVPLVEPF